MNNLVMDSNGRKNSVLPSFVCDGDGNIRNVGMESVDDKASTEQLPDELEATSFGRTMIRKMLSPEQLNKQFPDDVDNDIITDLKDISLYDPEVNPITSEVTFADDDEPDDTPLKVVNIVNPPLPKNILKTRPFVSVVVPTWKRRKFLPNLITQFNYQTYPQSNMELIIMDDSPTSNEDIIPKQANIRYIYIDEKIKLGYKRNLLNKAARGDIIVCFDDDDYYSPERVSHAVTKLGASRCQIAGSSVIHIYYTKFDKIYQFGPYKANKEGRTNHGTNGTMAYTRQYLKTHRYLDHKQQAEEAYFTNDFNEPMIQLDPHKVMLCISHKNNTIDKDQFLNQGKLVHNKIQKFFKINNKPMIATIKNYSSMQM
jgi:hypothetical protein